MAFSTPCPVGEHSIVDLAETTMLNHRAA